MKNFNKILFIFIILLSFNACTTVEKKTELKKFEKNEKYTFNLEKEYGKIEKRENVSEIGTIYRLDNADGTQFLEVYDPLEPLNRRIYYFNYYLDKYLLIPTVTAYETVTPNFMQKGVSNFFSNLQEISTFINSLLQFEGRKATIAFTRFGINSTLGILGLFDVASALELPKVYEDFGLTLAKYGVGNGPYLVLPGFGPSSLRDSVGMGVGAYTLYEINPYDSTFGVDINRWDVTGLKGIDTRKKVKTFRYYGTGSPFEYEYVRFIYTKYRTLLNEKGSE